MSHFKIAHLREQGQDMIIVPLDAAFGRRSQRERADFIDALQACAAEADLAGTVVPIWTNGRDVSFIAPPAWHPFFKSPGIWSVVAGNLNRELIIG
ncbi:hypothetical protein [Xanthomonas hortorum]|uniref:hypothetical protein n=1 Tax=Xanthomonas hortorum TaxID=56454 RepID=UPI00062D569A|nr:hypothetical protein [Xanthomonas hortorum]KLA95881.1 hypothetical protein SM19410_14105 [Xanthomonas hortorum pv. gardneri]KLB15204.1 hypothetical protein SM41311_21625 [Xanthomonas hortorum pv. gardneri]KLB23335.1 hypothetical protein SM40611_08865 [Xanthomonas hortorum pv. gardneri]